MLKDELLKIIIESGLDIEEIIEDLEDHLAEMEEIWDDEDLQYKVDEDGFYSLT